MPGRSPKSLSPHSPAAPGPHPFSVAEIDASGRWPLLFLFLKGSGWLVLGVFLLFLSSIKLHGPFLADSAWLGLGRLKPAAGNALVYGFACQYAFAIVLWILCRLGRRPLLNAPFIALAAAVWNVGVFLGILGILGGATTGFTFLEMPPIAWPFIFVALGVIALWALLTFHYRQERPLYVSQWYLVAALFWFPWMLSVAVFLLIFQPVRGVVQAVVNAWYVQNLFHLWLSPVALAALYYFIPKLTGRPLFSRQIALFAFWTLACFGGWGGLARWGGGPFPSWMISVGIAANVLMIVPLVSTTANLLLTVADQFRSAKNHLVLRFLFCGLAAYGLGGILTMVTSFRTAGQITLFTYIPMVLDHLMVLGFFGLVGLGSAYFIVPKLTGTPWPSPKLMRWHFYASVAGLGLYVVSLLLGGWIQGTRLNQPEIEFMQVAKASLPWVGISTLGLLTFLFGQIAFLINLQTLAWRWMAPICAATCALCLGRPAETAAKEAKS